MSSYSASSSVGTLRSTVVTRFLATMVPSDSQSRPPAGYGFPEGVGGPRPGHPDGPLRFLDGPLRTRRPLSPREAGKVHALVASLAVTGFTTLWRAGHLRLRNEAESGSLALRLARSLPGASTTGLRPTPPRSLSAERAICRVTSFQVTRSARLFLTLQRRKESDGPHPPFLLFPMAAPIGRSPKNCAIAAYKIIPTHFALLAFFVV